MTDKYEDMPSVIWASNGDASIRHDWYNQPPVHLSGLKSLKYIRADHHQQLVEALEALEPFVLEDDNDFVSPKYRQAIDLMKKTLAAAKEIGDE